MARWLRQGTSTDVPIGPFLDATDGVTAETALTLTQPDVRLKKNGGAWAQKAAAQTLSHEENGNYEVTLDATDTDTLGLLRLHVAETGALPVWEDFLVVPANVWDSLFGTDALQVHATEISNDLITAAAIATGAIDADALATDAITATKIAADAIGSSEFAQAAADKVWATTTRAITDKAGFSLSAAGIQAIWDALTSALTTASSIGKLLVDNLNATVSSRASQTSVDTVDDFLDTEIAAIKAKTDNLPATPAAVGSQMTLDLTQAVPTSNTAETVGDALNAARAQGFGKWTLSGTTLTLFAADGSTTVRTFTLDSATEPTSRT